MLKKLGAVAAATAAGMMMMGGMASATEGGDHGSLVDVDNVDLLHNTNVVTGACGNDVNVNGIGAQVQDVAKDIALSLNLPIASPGYHEAEANSGTPDPCATGSVNDAGSVQDS